MEPPQLVVVAVEQQEVEKGDVAGGRRPWREATRSAIMVPRPIRRRARRLGPTMRTNSRYHQQQCSGPPTGAPGPEPRRDAVAGSGSGNRYRSYLEPSLAETCGSDGWMAILTVSAMHGVGR